MTSCKLKIWTFNNKTTILLWYFDSILKSLSNQNDTVFKMESKYHRKNVVSLFKAYILSSQDVILRSMFFLISFQ